MYHKQKNCSFLRFSGGTYLWGVHKSFTSSVGTNRNTAKVNKQWRIRHDRYKLPEVYSFPHCWASTCCLLLNSPTEEKHVQLLLTCLHKEETTLALFTLIQKYKCTESCNVKDSISNTVVAIQWPVPKMFHHTAQSHNIVTTAENRGFFKPSDTYLYTKYYISAVQKTHILNF